VLESGQIRLSFDSGAFTVNYYGIAFPFPRTYELILSHRLEELQKVLGPEDPPLLEYQSILTAVRLTFPTHRDDAEKIAGAAREESSSGGWQRSSRTMPPSANHRAQRAAFQRPAGHSRSFDLLDPLLRPAGVACRDGENRRTRSRRRFLDQSRQAA